MNARALSGADPDLQVVADLLHAEFDDHLDPHAVDECLSQVAARFDGASIRSFVPLLVRRYARDELKSRAGDVAVEGVERFGEAVGEVIRPDPVQQVVGTEGVDQTSVCA